MDPSRATYSAWCLMCGREVGRILRGGFVQHAGCSAPMLARGGLRRCCHCAGSLYLEKSEPASRAEAIAELMAAS